MFPGLAVAQALKARGIEVVLFVSPKDVDRRALHGKIGRAARGKPSMVGLDRRNLPSFLRALWRGYRVSSGSSPTGFLTPYSAWGITSAGPILAGWRRASLLLS